MWCLIVLPDLSITARTDERPRSAIGWADHGEAFADSIDGQMERLGALAAAMDEHHPADDCWYLLAIGVRPSAQGRGLGGRMLTHTLDQIDTANEPAYLEATSPRSWALYERCGFAVTGESPSTTARRCGRCGDLYLSEERDGLIPSPRTARRDPPPGSRSRVGLSIKRRTWPG